MKWKIPFTAVCAWELSIVTLCIVYFYSKLLALQGQVKQMEQKPN